MKTSLRILGSTLLPCLILLSFIGCSGGSEPSLPATPTPSISSVTPTSVQANQTAPFPVTITGSGFTSASQVQVNGTNVSTTYVSSTQLQAQVPASLASSGGQLVFTVTNGSISSGPASSDSTITVTNPTPTITSLSPSSAVLGTSSITVTATGTGFVPTTTLSVSGASHSVTYVSSTQITVTLSAADLTSTGSLNLVATNASPGGGTSSTVLFSVVNPTPIIASINPTTVAAGGGDLPLTLQGTGFLSTSTVLWNGTSLATTFVSSTQLGAVVPAASITPGATAQITVANPSPGGGVSGAIAFAVDAPSPVLTGISPHTVKVNQAATITLTGSGFTSSSVVQWNGSSAPTTFINPTSLQVALAAADLSTVQTGKLTVTTPAPGGGTSSAQPLVVTNLPIPTVTNISFTTITGNGCTQLQFTATGTNFSGTTSFKVTGVGATIRTFGTSTSQTGTLPPGLSVQPASTAFTAVSTIGGTAVNSEPFTLPTSTPALLAICATPNGATIFPGSSFVATFTPSSVNVTSPATLTGITPPAGITTSTSLPLSLASTGSRMTFQADSSLATGTASIPFSAAAGAATATGTVSFNVSAATPPAFYLSTLVRELAVPIGGSGQISFQGFANNGSVADYTVDIAVSGLPAGTTATITPSTIIPGDSFTVNITAAANAPVTQNATITVTGTPSSTATSTPATFLLDVTQAPGNLPNNRSDFVSTAATPYAMVYNRTQDLIYASNPTWNRIDIISNANRKLLQSVPVRGPSSMDLSPDGSTLWIGTQSQQIYAMDTTSLALTRYFAPPLTGVYGNQVNPITWQANQLDLLADGTLLLNRAPAAYTGFGGNTFIWNPSQNTATNVPFTYTLYLPSGDGTKVFGVSYSGLSCQNVVYDTMSKSYSSSPSSTQFCGFVAVNHDGSRLVGRTNQGFALYDGSFQLIGNLPTSVTSTGTNLGGGWIFSPDGSTLYQIGTNTQYAGAYIQTFDVASLSLKGTAPAISTSGNNYIAVPSDVDQNGILLGIQNYGISFDDSRFFQTYATTSLIEPWPISLIPPAGPLSGGTVSYPFANYDLVPDIWYGPNRGTASGVGAYQTSLTSPPGNANGPVNLKYIFPNGDQVLTPRAFSYSVYPEYSILSGASPNGGVPGEIAGYGMPVDASGGTITVGGHPATITTTATQYLPYTPEPFPSTYLNYTIPAGAPGYADLQITTPDGSGTLPKAVFYARSVSDYASTDTFTDVLYDEARKQVYLAAGDHIDVFSMSSNQFGTPLTPANLNGSAMFRGLALTPDGSTLLAANMTDGSLGAINPDSPSQTYAIAIAAPTGTGTTCATGPFAVIGLAGNQAFVSAGLPPGIGGCGQNNQLYMVNLQTRSSGSAPTTYGCDFNNVDRPAGLQSTTDGTTVMLNTLSQGGACLYSTRTNKFILGPGGVISYFGAAIAGDGNIAAVGNEFSDLAGNALGLIGRPFVFYGSSMQYSPVNTYPTNTLLMPRLNASGSLYFWAFPNYFEIIDVPTGTLRMRFSLSETVNNVEAPIAVDGAGRQVFLITNAGLTVVDLGIAPLSIGHLTPNGGGAGTQIQVRGSGFVTGATALVGGQSATVSFVDENTLNLTVPSIPSGPQDLTITNPDGTTYTLKSAITVP